MADNEHNRVISSNQDIYHKEVDSILAPSGDGTCRHIRKRRYRRNRGSVLALPLIWSGFLGRHQFWSILILLVLLFIVIHTEVPPWEILLGRHWSKGQSL
jgi:hypothetical protein